MFKVFTLFLLILLASSVIFADELEDRKSIKNNVSHMFLSGQYQALSDLSKKYLETEDRTSSGLWKLTLFYSGIERAVDKKNRDEKYWLNIEENALGWVKNQPNSPSGYVAYAVILIQHAYMYRGEGWADEVREEDWKPFYAYVNKAYKYLNENKAIASKDPRWYETMLIIAKLKSFDKADFESLFNEIYFIFWRFYASFRFLLKTMQNIHSFCKFHGINRSICIPKIIFNNF